MAEINIQRKETSIWPWVIGGVVLVLLVMFLAGVFDGDDAAYDETAGVDTTAQVAPSGQPGAAPAVDGAARAHVNTYVAYVQRDTAEVMGIHHEYTGTALKNLAVALDAVAAQILGSDADSERIRTELVDYANRLQQEPTATNHADLIRKAAVSASDLMERLQRNSFPGLQGEVAEARQAAQAIDPATLTLEQRERIHTFLQEASDVLEAMVRGQA